MGHTTKPKFHPAIDGYKPPKKSRDRKKRKEKFADTHAPMGDHNPLATGLGSTEPPQAQPWLPPNPEPETTDLSPDSGVWDQPESRTILNLVPDTFRMALIAASAAQPQYFGLDERTLWKLLRSHRAEPTQVDNQLRVKFWLEYECANEERRKMNLLRVYSGICSHAYFYTRLVHSPGKLAWIITHPMNYEAKLEESLSYAVERMRDYLEIDIEEYPHAQRIKLMELQAKIYAMLDMRKRGAYTQKIEQKNMSLNVSTTAKELSQVMANDTMEQLDLKIKELEKREQRALNLSTVAEVAGVHPEPVTVEAEVSDHLDMSQAESPPLAEPQQESGE